MKEVLLSYPSETLLKSLMQYIYYSRYKNTERNLVCSHTVQKMNLKSKEIFFHNLDFAQMKFFNLFLNVDDRQQFKGSRLVSPTIRFINRKQFKKSKICSKSRFLLFLQRKREGGYVHSTICWNTIHDSLLFSFLVVHLLSYCLNPWLFLLLSTFRFQ